MIMRTVKSYPIVPGTNVFSWPAATRVLDADPQGATIVVSEPVLAEGQVSPMRERLILVALDGAMFEAGGWRHVRSQLGYHVFEKVHG